MENDNQEIKEWEESFNFLLKYSGKEKAKIILEKLYKKSIKFGIFFSSYKKEKEENFYINTIPCTEDKKPPFDGEISERVSSIIRWNAILIVLKTLKKNPELGGNISSYASYATIYDIGFDYFFCKDDLIYFQGHSITGIYSRAFLEGRIKKCQLKNFRKEINKNGLSSYPHPWLMPNFWQFSTVSMGLGPIQAVYNARFLKYLKNRNIIDTSNRKVWVFCGDGEMDEPESLSSLSLAGREKLDNLIFIVNCNLQSLDGPVRGNSKIIVELESIFKGFNWHVIKVLWSKEWDILLKKDSCNILKERMKNCVDGEMQKYQSRDISYFKKNFFGKSKKLLNLIKGFSDKYLKNLKFGGHDSTKIYTAYKKALKIKGKPVVLLFKTVKGFGMGKAGEGLNISHQQKYMSEKQLMIFSNRFKLNISKEDIKNLNFYKPKKNSKEMKYIKNRLKERKGHIPYRRVNCSENFKIPSEYFFNKLIKKYSYKNMSTNLAFILIIKKLLNHKRICKRIIPIVSDGSRTFGMEDLYSKIGIYSHCGQLYSPEDSKNTFYYKESKDGQIIQDGINEAGAFSSWIAAATSYSNNNYILIPFYIFYSIFGFQRIGDLIWAAADMRARGFLIGGISGKTSLPGEGLQHQDGNSQLIASTIPNCISYNPCFFYELVFIIEDGFKRMMRNQEDVFYYITLTNEVNSSITFNEKINKNDIIKGMSLIKTVKGKSNYNINLLGSGSILKEVLKASNRLNKDFKITCNVWSVTSFNILSREAEDYYRKKIRDPFKKHEYPHIIKCLKFFKGPVLAVTDYVRSYGEQIRKFINKKYLVLGTDGFGRSDTRRKLREFFEIDYKSISYNAIKLLLEDKQIESKFLLKAIKIYKINPNKVNPLNI